MTKIQKSSKNDKKNFFVTFLTKRLNIIAYITIPQVGKQNLHEDVLKKSWRGVDLEDFFSLKRGDPYLLIILLLIY